MDSIILTSIIAAASACIGALIPCLFSYLGRNKEYKMERLSKIEEIRRAEYAIYLEALQTMINDSSRYNFLQLQTSTNRLLLFAGPALSAIVNEYYTNLIERNNSGNPLLLAEHDEYQTKIVNAMRCEMGVSTKGLRKVRIVRA